MDNSPGADDFGAPLATLQDAARYLAHAGPAEMPAETQADALRGCERATTRHRPATAGSAAPAAPG